MIWLENCKHLNTFDKKILNPTHLTPKRSSIKLLPLVIIFGFAFLMLTFSFALILFPSESTCCWYSHWGKAWMFISLYIPHESITIKTTRFFSSTTKKHSSQNSHYTIYLHWFLFKWLNLLKDGLWELK